MKKIIIFSLFFVLVIFLILTNYSHKEDDSLSAFDYFAWKKEKIENTRCIEHTFRPGESLYDVLIKRYKILPSVATSYLTAINKTIKTKKIRPGGCLKIYFNNQKLQKITYQYKPDVIYIFRYTPYGISHKIKREKTYVRLDCVSGTIRTSLYESALEHGIDPSLALELADIFAWDIDFFTDIRPNDSYRILYERIYTNGKFTRNGRILAAEFVNKGRRLEAYYFEDPTGHKDYYDANGRSLRKAFLRAPLRYKRISSYFSYHRLHPILGIVRPHLGIDYAAPIGTPVEAVGDGRVVFIGWKRGFGKFIKIRHNHIYTSTYGHLSRFARGLRRGSFVKQGQVIGYVGSTGLSTGPHLDFRFMAHGRYINYLKFKQPESKSIPRCFRLSFRENVERLRNIMESKFYAAIDDDLSMR